MKRALLLALMISWVCLLSDATHAILHGYGAMDPDTGVGYGNSKPGCYSSMFPPLENGGNSLEGDSCKRQKSNTLDEDVNGSLEPPKTETMPWSNMPQDVKRLIMMALNADGAIQFGQVNKEMFALYQQRLDTNGFTLYIKKVRRDVAGLARFLERHKCMTSLTITQDDHSTFINAVMQLKAGCKFDQLSYTCMDKDEHDQDKLFGNEGNDPAMENTLGLLKHFFSRTSQLKRFFVSDYNGQGDNLGRAIFNIPNTIRLTHLDLKYSIMGDEGVKILACSSNVANLTHLDLTGNHIGDEGVKALANSSHLANLTHLALTGNHIGDGGITALAFSPNMANLTHLALANNTTVDTDQRSLGLKTAQSIANSPHLSNLTHLRLADSRIGDIGAEAIANSPHLSNLTHLSLGDSRIGEIGAQAIVEGANAQNLVQLNMDANDIKTVGAVSILNSPKLSRLRFLSLCHNDIDFTAIPCNGDFSLFLPLLKSLDLSSNKIKDDGVKALVYRLNFFSNLASLELSYNHQFGNTGAKSLASYLNLPLLTALTLKHTGISAEGAESIAASPQLQGLESLELNWDIDPILSALDLMPKIKRKPLPEVWPHEPSFESMIALVGNDRDARWPYNCM